SCQDDLVWADHIVFIYPIWWGSYPALLKGYLDTVFMSRFAYKYKKFWPIDIPKGLLKGKSARIIQTSGGPNILAWPLFGSLFGTVYPGERALRDGTLRFCGIFNVKISRLDNLQNNASQKRIQKFLRKVYRLGSKHK
ncbi:NAD(P)H-dependent oxidoreductase, partial [Candidatus Dojkabacteria bacterium]|nr:NAD(P)H-dependent oxidoreductase [Candidatus Dojkabacteria bacterium]